MPDDKSLSEVHSKVAIPGSRGFLRRLTALILLWVLVLTAGCAIRRDDGTEASAPKDLSDRKIHVVTTIGMITEMVKQVGGERVDV